MDKETCVTPVIDPLQNTFEEDKKNFPEGYEYDEDVERTRSLNKQIAARPEVWDVGLWPDAESESIAKEFAHFCEMMYPQILRAAFVPNDRLEVIEGFAETFDDGVVYSLLDIELKSFGCVVTFEELKKMPDVTFGDLVALVKARKTKMPRIDEPRRKSEVRQEQLASLDRYEKATVGPKIAPWIVVVVLVALCVYCCYIRHPWGIVPALGLCYIGFWVLYQRCSRFAKFVDRLLG